MRYAQSMQAYTDVDHRALLTECGFTDVKFFPSLVGVEDETQSALFVIVAHK
jgi:hypothetical protein